MEESKKLLLFCLFVNILSSFSVAMKKEKDKEKVVDKESFSVLDKKLPELCSQDDGWLYSTYQKVNRYQSLRETSLNDLFLENNNWEIIINTSRWDNPLDVISSPQKVVYAPTVFDNNKQTTIEALTHFANHQKIKTGADEASGRNLKIIRTLRVHSMRIISPKQNAYNVIFDQKTEKPGYEIIMVGVSAKIDSHNRTYEESSNNYRYPNFEWFDYCDAVQMKESMFYGITENIDRNYQAVGGKFYCIFRKNPETINDPGQYKKTVSVTRIGVIAGALVCIATFFLSYKNKI